MKNTVVINGEPIPTHPLIVARLAELETAFNAQARELEIALEFLTPETITEFRRKAYPEARRSDQTEAI